VLLGAVAGAAVWACMRKDPLAGEWTVRDDLNRRAVALADAPSTDVRDRVSWTRTTRRVSRRPTSEQTKLLASLINARFGTADLLRGATSVQRLAMYQYAIKQLSNDENRDDFVDVRRTDYPQVARNAVRLALVLTPELAEMLAEESGPIGRLDDTITRLLAPPLDC
jgi:hypothetical protein